MKYSISSGIVEVSYPHVLPLELVHETSRKIIAFERTLRLSPSLSPLVQHLWLGPGSAHAEHDPSDLSYASSAWPVTLLHQILVKCTNLKSLALINFAQHLMYRIVGVIPPSVTAIHAGPVHGHLDVRHLRCAANLTSVTSMDTYLSDWEVCELAGAPYLKTIRRFYSTRTAIQYAFDQLTAVRSGRTLEKMEILCCTGAEDVQGTLDALKELAKEREGSDDGRVIITARTSCSQGGRFDGISTFYDDWIDSLDTRRVQRSPV
ncbi:hypothetical protein DAEQUDRAFT_743962 [Daedalea quercina L-15889]|uniref:F-box domain-containing protein n=1 Tax=Daedalea quercina L-15889 TaxID=1314783 RepID=A0A165SE85_9APHY|nr:hypothetical protein DAEQUDRAFT_743962 [Daedalea quercina L-15889]